MIVRFAGDYFAKGELSKIRGLYLKIVKYLFILSIIGFVLFFLFISQIGDFFHIENKTVLIITDIIIFISFISAINGPFIVAKLAFKFQMFLYTLSTLVKLLLGIALVLVGLNANGAVIAMLVAVIVSYSLSFIPIRFIFDNKISTPKINTRDLFNYGIPSALTTLGLTSFITSDIILVKHFFTPQNAGFYAGLALVSKVIFYLSAPIGSVMFPLIVQKHSKKEKVLNTFFLSLVMVFIPSICLAIFYFFYPDFALLFFLKNKAYLIVKPYLGWFALFISLYCLLSLITNFYLSIGKTKVCIPIFTGAILQIILISNFHQTFLQIISISLIITFLLVVSLLVYYPYATKKE
jgi:O-antigen/teichoic acid export membrane protein